MSEIAVANAIGEMVDFFMPHCADTSTLSQLKAMAADRKRWRKGHSLFGTIRDKTLHADSANDVTLQHQYGFEEICAKTLFNISDCTGPPYPFDDDSPFWVIPLALGFARHLGIDDPLAMSRILQPQSDG